VPQIGAPLPLFLTQNRQGPLQPPSVFDGRFISSLNTGLNYLGVDPASLTPQGSTTFSTPGQTVTGKAFTGQVNLGADNITLQGCSIGGGGADTFALVVTGNNCTVTGCLILPTGGNAFYIAVSVQAAGLTLLRNDISRCENGITHDAGSPANSIIRENYIHNLTGPDCDGIEVYNGSNITIQNNRMDQSDSAEITESGVNIAPYGGSRSVSNVVLTGNYLNGPCNTLVLVDLQSTGTITGTKVYGNYMGGNTNPGVFGHYMCLQNSQSRPLTNDDAGEAANPNSILWPTTAGGSAFNYWYNCAGLSPDRTGTVALPGQQG
jgi:hypothetical protein